MALQRKTADAIQLAIAKGYDDVATALAEAAIARAKKARRLK